MTADGRRFEAYEARPDSLKGHVMINPRLYHNRAELGTIFGCLVRDALNLLVERNFFTSSGLN